MIYMYSVYEPQTHAKEASAPGSYKLSVGGEEAGVAW